MILARRRAYGGRLVERQVRHEQAIDTTTQPFSRYARVFEACRWAPSSYNGQTTRAFVETGSEDDLAAVTFSAVTASRYYAPVALGIWCANWEIGCAALGEQGAFEGLPASEGTLPHHDVTWRPMTQSSL